MHIRDAISDDLPVIIQLFQNTVRKVNIRDYAPEQIAAWSGQTDEEKWRKRLLHHLVLLAIDNDEMVGFITLESNGHVDHLFVDAERQRQGIAAMLYGELETRARAMGLKKLFSEVSITARAAAERGGFVVEREQTVEIGGKTLTNFVMSKNLADNISSTFAEKESARHKIKLGVFLFLIRDGKILLLRRHNTGIQDGLYVVPMGSVEKGETASSAILREAQEEAGICITAANTSACHIMHRLHTMPDGFAFEQIDLFFRAEIFEGEIRNCEPHKCDDLRFFSMNALPPNLSPFIKSAIDCVQKGQIFSEFGWDAKNE